MPTFTVPSEDGVELHGYAWVPEQPKAIVQIAHGMSEHAARYERVALALNEAGYAVYAHDHRGHGKTARSDDDVGHFADEGGWQKVLADVKRVQDHARAAHPGKKLALFGHSMGSFFVQHFLFAYPGAVDAAVLSGSNGKVGFLAVAGSFAARFERMRLGKRGKSELLDKMSFGAFNDAFKPVRTKFDWLSRDAAEVDKYVADPRCGFKVTTQTWLEVLTGLQIIENPANQAKVPKELPIYVFSGSKDPVSNATKNLRQLLDAYQAAGLTRVEHRFYEDARHETLNETNRDEVTRDLVAFLDKTLAA